MKIIIRSKLKIQTRTELWPSREQSFFEAQQVQVSQWGKNGLRYFFAELQKKVGNRKSAFLPLKKKKQIFYFGFIFQKFTGGSIW